MTPGKVPLEEKVIQVSAGDSHTAALTEAGTVYIWGSFRVSSVLTYMCVFFMLSWVYKLFHTG